MKILIVNSLDAQGGAAKAAYRLHKSLLKNNINSNMLVQNKSIDDYTILREEGTLKKIFNKFRSYIDALPLKLYKNRMPTFFSIGWLPSNDLIKKINEINPDVVHLHWISNGMLNINSLKKIKAPIVWSLHDNWLFTGGCHVKWNCEKFKTQCSNCPQLKSNRNNDLSSIVWKKKKDVFSNLSNITIIGLSKWIMNASLKSSILSTKNHINLPNVIDTNLFKPINKEISRNILNLPQNKKLILFAAISAISDINKGFKELTEALKEINENDIELVIIGSNKPKEEYDFGFKTHYLGHIHDDFSLISIYNSVDLTIVPSLQENLSNVILESMSCSTPVVSFDIGGNSDLIEHKKNGYLANAYSSNDLAQGIIWCLTNKNQKEISDSSRKKIISNFSENVVIPKYIELYKKVINEYSYKK